jgi:hypothetical protein
LLQVGEMAPYILALHIILLKRFMNNKTDVILSPADAVKAIINHIKGSL